MTVPGTLRATPRARNHGFDDLLVPGRPEEQRAEGVVNRKLRRSSHRSVAELEADLSAWIAAWNQDPRPFVWTKTADEILDTLANYLQRTNDSEH